MFSLSAAASSGVSSHAAAQTHHAAEKNAATAPPLTPAGFQRRGLHLRVCEKNGGGVTEMLLEL